MIELTIEGNKAVIILNRPPANAFNAEGLAEFKRVVHQLDSDERVRAIVVTGAGEKFFSAGADLGVFADGDMATAREMAVQFGAAFETLQNARAFVIAAINGFAMGGGLECALSCDVRIAEEQAVLALPECAVGLLPAGCGTQTLPWLVGEGWAKRMILANEKVDAKTALRIGLVEEVVEKKASLSAALALADRAAVLRPLSVAYSKRLIHQARDGVSRSAALAVERERFVDLFKGADQREGVAAFLEKRPPKWTGD